jgi:3-isopropylmalate/(R)-2-methylmalate dehydratase small subunit
MKSFTTLKSHLIPLPYADVDTDQIIPARYLKVIDKSGLAEGLFVGWRYLPDGSINTDFVLNQIQYKDAQILLTGDNFGCGSSREHAPWALAAWGIRAIISTSFADIFRNNALKNGLLPIEVDPEILLQLFSLVAEEPSMHFVVDLAAQTLKISENQMIEFDIDAFSKKCLLAGVDQLGFLLKHKSDIIAYEQATGRGVENV